MDSLVAIAIHDAKNALTALNTWLDEARRQAPSPALEEARAVAARVSGQLVELLALYRAGQGTLRLAIDDRYLEDFLAEVMVELGPVGTVAVVTDFAAADELGTWAFDAYQVKFVLLDALRNALRHAKTRVVFALRAEPEGGIRFSIGDDGDGYPREVLEGIAAPMESGTSGLGLSFARLVADMHRTPAGRRGHVELENVGGARFSLVLP